MFNFFISITSLNAQIAGTSTTNTIEQKANSIVDIEIKIANLKTTRQRAYTLETDKLRELRLDLSALRTEMEDVFVKDVTTPLHNLEIKVYNVEKHFFLNHKKAPD